MKKELTPAEWAKFSINRLKEDDQDKFLLLVDQFHQGGLEELVVDDFLKALRVYGTAPSEQNLDTYREAISNALFSEKPREEDEEPYDEIQRDNCNAGKVLYSESAFMNGQGKWVVL